MLATFDGTQVEYEEKYTPINTGYIVHDSTWDEVKKSRPTLNGAPLLRPGTDKILAGLPDVYRYRGINGNKEPEHIELYSDRQHYLLYLNITKYKNVHWHKSEYFAWFYLKNAEVKWAARELTGALTHDRSHTNALGMDNCQNFLTGDLDREGLPKFSKILTGRARLKLYNGVREIKTIPGVGACVAFHAINASKDLWQWNWWDNPELFDRPCITGREVRFNTGTPYIYRDDLHYPYDHFSGRLIFPLWLPNSDKGFVLEALTRPMLSSESMDKFS